MKLAWQYLVTTAGYALGWATFVGLILGTVFAAVWLIVRGSLLLMQAVGLG
jgi:hypothetical protein